jgi:APA family basic amino acid/polyamine antiporter
MGFCLGIFPILAVLGVFKLRLQETDVSRAILFVSSTIFAIVSLAILVLAYFERPLESTIALVTVAVGVPFYVLFARSAERGTGAQGNSSQQGMEP